MYLIVGIDPGKTTGIACIDLNGKLVISNHMEFGGLDWITELISNAGTPIIIASDRKKAGATLRKINASFNSRLFLPSKELSIGKRGQLQRLHQ